MVAAMASMELIAGSSVGGEFDFDFSVDGLGAFLAGSVRLLCGGFFVAGRGRTLVAWYGFWISGFFFGDISFISCDRYAADWVCLPAEGGEDCEGGESG